MGQLTPLSGFDMETFPFIVWSRETTINLVNLKEQFVEPLITREYASYEHRGQDSFFLKGKIYGMSIHFSAKQIFPDGSVRLNMCKMNLKPDMIKMLKEYGTIPK